VLAKPGDMNRERPLQAIPTVSDAGIRQLSGHRTRRSPTEYTVTSGLPGDQTRIST
jgi:hypothetical protein